MNILQINVRLNEGGAAGVALDLHRRIEQSTTNNSNYIYGYGKGAKPNILETELTAIHIGSRLQIALNYFFHQLLNFDLIRPTGIRKRKLITNIEWADIIHIHVIHSFFIPFPWLVELLVDSGKKIVWTLHDHWLVTGRCAFTDECSQWKSRCQKCPKLTNYPPVLFDCAKYIYPKKRKLIKNLSDAGCVFVSPSEHLLKDIKLAFPELNIKIINNSLDLETELIIKYNSYLKTNNTGKIRVLVIANDLEYEGKTNRTLVNKIIQINNIELHTVGKNSPFIGENIINHGYLKSKKDLYKVYTNIDIMIFSSIVDNFPLVIGEALCNGIPVIASNSFAAKEVLSLVGGIPAISPNEIISAINNKDWMKKFYFDQSIESIKVRAITKFSGRRMLDEYLSIYKDL